MWDNHQALRGLATALTLAALAMLLYAGGFWLVHSPLFPVRSIYIQGALKRVTPVQLKYIAEHELAGTFFTLDIDKTRAAFQKLPWVSEAQVRRRWPDALFITVNEHVALARWGENGLIDTNGEWFDAASDQNLPVLVGPAGSEKTLATALPKLQQALGRSNLSAVQVEMSARGAWRIELSNEIRLELGRNDVEARTRRFAEYWKGNLAALPYKIEYVDMRYPNGFAVRMPDYKGSAAQKTKP